MTDAQTDSNDALLTLIDMAHEEIASAITDSESDGSIDILQLCRDHVENIGWAAEMAGYDRLKSVIDAVGNHLNQNSLNLSEEQIVEFVIWLSDIKLYLDAPDDEDTFNLLYNPLPDELPSSPGLNSSGETSPETIDSEDIVEHAFDDNEADIDTDNILGMLASEIVEISPQLAEIAGEIATQEDTEYLSVAVNNYQELVNRIGTVSEELGLNGLFLVCQFVNKNISEVVNLDSSDRPAAIETMLGWPQVVIQHLIDPTNDALCLAVVDYLELENWPSPLPYRDVRDLIEGLTAQLEISGDFEGETREIEASPEDVSLTLSEDISAELIEAFFAESPGHAETFSKLVETIANGKDIQNSVEAAQRIAHTLKGSGNLVGAKGIANLSHHIEDIFEYIAKHQITPPRALSNTMQEAADTIEVMLEYLQGMAPLPEDAQRVLQDVLDWANRIDSGNLRQDDFSDAETADSPSETSSEALPADFVERRKEPTTEAAPAVAVAETVRVPLYILDNVFRIVSETAITIGQIQEHLNRLEDGDKMIRKNDSALQQQRYELENLVSIRGMAAQHRYKAAAGGNASGFDPLEMDEYDEFYGAAHSYIEGVADSREILREVTNEVSELSSLFLLQQRLNKELQQVVMTTRMVPVSNIASRLQRAVRQVCRATGKQAELTISGEDLLMDGDVLNKLADPLMHMLRNAVDHSIETSDNRFDLGKPVEGKIALSFRQEGNSVVVDCADDGQGLNYDRIRETAIQRGLLTEHEQVDDPALARMILHSGFSTSEQLTQVSGRGVGMDVVHNTIQSLNGAMEVADSTDGGTLISMRLPITLLTSHCLLAGVGEDFVYAIPTVALTQILSPGTGKIGEVGGQVTYQLGKDVYMVYSLKSLLGIPDDGEIDIENATVLLVQTVEGVIAVSVEQVISSYDLVIKNLGAYIKSVRGVAGVSILGNGNVIAVLDLPTLLQTRDNPTASLHAGNYQQPAAEEIRLPSVLIVDDSLSVRNSLSQLMSDGGYRALTARDGLEAINVIDRESPDIVLTDLEMPRMNGLELVSHIRNTEQISDLPIVMVTSRTMAKHRQQAEQAGVNRYITKPFTEDEVLASIDDHLSQIS